MLQKVVFLDRDGVINRDSPDYIKSWEEFEFIPGSIDAIRELTANGFVSIVITNQSAVARKLMTLQQLHHIHSMMNKAVSAAAGRITDIFFCPHLPEDGCTCRKPGPGLILQARDKYDIDLGAAVMVGDSVRDMAAARNAGCGKAVLVKTGLDGDVEERLRAGRIRPDYVAPDLYAAVHWILQEDRKRR